LQSEYEKMRHRYERERESIRQTMQGELMQQILPLMDNFERAMLHATAGEVSENFVTGIVLLYKQLSDLLEQNQVIPIMATGENFNPEFHEAVVIEPASDCEANTVIAELEKGYTIGTRLLRPARVKVAVRPK
jgi:molecular chaperone GrpE